MLAYGSHLGRWKGVPPLTILKYQQQNENELNKKRADPIEPALYINL
jgi:hypothetical protein